MKCDISYHSRSICCKMFANLCWIAFLLAISFPKIFGYKDARSLLKVPDFFIIGAMKCGTTSLNRLMFDHPSICNYGEKEKHFFDKTRYDTDYESHLEEYLSEFSECKSSQFTIDSTPSYIQYDEVPARLNESYAMRDLYKKKFILILREPVLRFFSEYQMRLRVCFKGLYWNKHNGDDDDYESNLRLHRNCHNVMHNYTARIQELPKKHHHFMTFPEWVFSSHDGQTEISRGYYADHMRTWLRYIPRSQIFVIDFQHLILNTNDVMLRVADFLGIDPKLWKHSKGSQGISLPTPKSQKADFKDGILDCDTFAYLRHHYDKANLNLTYLINRNDPKGGPWTTRPRSELYFHEWNYTKPACVTVGNVTRAPSYHVDTGDSNSNSK